MLKLAAASTLSIVVVSILFLWMHAATTPPSPPEATHKREHQTAGLQPEPSADIRESSSCDKLIDSYRAEIENYRACSDDSECFHVRSGWLPMLAANRQFSHRVNARIAALAQACGERPSHDAFYSDYGVEILCGDQQCTVSEITSEDLRARLEAGSKRTLRQLEERTR